MVKGKKGAELSINVIVILILAILALLVISVIFLGGAGSLNERLQNIFGGTTVVYEPEYFKLQCEQYCSAAQTADDPAKTPWCTFTFERVDTDGNGEPNLLTATCDKLVPTHLKLDGSTSGDCEDSAGTAITC